MSSLDTLRSVCQITITLSVLMLFLVVVFAYKKAKQGKDVQVLTTVLSVLFGLMCVTSVIGVLIIP